MFEEFIIRDDNWYSYDEMERKFPSDTMYCWIKGDNIKNELYQPKLKTTKISNYYLEEAIRSYRNDKSEFFVGNGIPALNIGVIVNQVNEGL